MADGDIKKMQVVVEAKTDGVKQQLDTVSKGVSDVKKAIQSATGVSFGDLENSLKATYTEAKKVTSELAKTFSPAQITQGIQQAKSQMRSAEKEMRKYADTGGQMFKNASFDYQDAKGRLEGLTTELHKVKNTANSIEIKGLKDDRPMANVKAINSKWLKNLKENGWYSPDVDTIKNTYQGVELNDYKPTANIDDYTQKLAYVSPEIEKVTTKLGTLKFYLRKAFSQEGLDKFSEKLSWLSQKADVISKKMGNFARTVGRIGKKFLSAISPMRMFRNEQNKTSNSSNILSKAFSRLARMFRIMVTRMLIRGFISNIREGFQNIAQYSDEVNQKFSSIIASAKTLYNATASAFTPIIEALTPIITKALDTMVYAMNKVAEFMSALTGKSYFIKATKYQYDYAKSLDKTSKSAGKTAKKVKELKSATIGIDKLNVIEPNKPTNASSGSGNGNKGANANDMFDTKPVSKRIKDLAKEVREIAKKLFDPIQEAWNKKGAKVLGSFKSMLGSIWETIKAIGRDFLTMWAQPQTEIIFEDILDTVATIFDIVTAISDQFRKAWNKDNVGLHIFENLRDVVGIVVKRIKKCAEYTRDWARHLNFSPMLQSIERYTKSLKKLVKGLSDIAGDFYETVVLGISKWVVEKGLPQLIKIFTDFNNEVDWKGLRKSLREVWKGVSHFAKAVGQGLIDFIDDLVDGIRSLLNSKWFKDFLEGVADALKSIPSGAITNFLRLWVGIKAVKGVSGILGGVASKLGLLIAKIRMFKYSAIGGKIISAFGNIGGKIGNMLGGIDTKLGGFFSNSTSKIKGFVSSLGGLKGMLGIGIATWAGYKIADIMTDYEMAVNTAKYLNEEEKKYLAKLDEEHQKHLDNLQATKDQIDEVLGLKDKAYDYKKELDGIVDKNGNIKKGYEGQAQYLIDQLNPALDDNMEIIDGQVEGYKRGTKQLEKQLDLVAQKKILEQGATQYYDNKGELEKGANELSKIQDKIKKSSKATFSDAINTITSGGNPIAMIDNAMKLYKGDKNTQNALKSYKDTLKSIRESYRYNIRYEALQNAKSKKARDKALKNMRASLTKQEKATFNTIAKVSIKYNKSIPELITKNKNFEKAIKEAGLKGKKISQKLREGFLTGKISTDKIIEYQKLYEQAKKKSPKIAKEIANGIKGNKKSVQDAINKLQGIINKIKGKKASVGVEKSKGFDTTLTTISNKIKKGVPKTVDVTVEAKLNIKSFKNVSGASRKIARMVKAGWEVTSMATSGGHKFAILKKGNKKRKVRTMASGGFPKLGSEFIAGEKGAEFVGNINGKTGVASNQEITGIRDSIVETSNAQIQMLNEQNSLLRGILEKNTDIVLDGQKVTKRVNQINARSGYKMAT